MKPQKPTIQALETWSALNDALRTAGEKACERLLVHEAKGKNRPTFLLRIHSRLNRVRRERERAALAS